MRKAVRRFVAVASASALATVTALTAAAAPAAAAPVPVFPGMEIQQDANVCTLGFVDPDLRIAYTAGHCRGSGPVFDGAGNRIGTMALYRDTMLDGSVVRADDLIVDYQIIALAADVAINDILPGGRRLESDPAVVATEGQRVCHFGISTGESCGIIDSLNNGWFTMSGGVVSRQGDSGGPVYVEAGNGRAVIVGMFNSTWGTFPAAVSWQATNEQVRTDAPSALAANRPTPPNPVTPPVDQPTAAPGPAFPAVQQPA